MILPVRDYDDLPPIPRVIHQIWVGAEPPAWVLRSWDEWDTYAERYGYTIRRWGNGDLAGTFTGRLYERYPEMPPVQVADFLRVEVMARFGGVYMDCDTIPLRPLDEYMGDRPGWIGQGPMYWGDEVGDEWQQGYNNATMGFPEGHPLLAALWEYGVRALRRGVTDTFAVIGPTTYIRLIRPAPDHWWIEKAHGPFYSVRHKDKQRFQRRGRAPSPQELSRMYPEALVVHMSMAWWQERKDTSVSSQYKKAMG